MKTFNRLYKLTAGNRHLYLFALFCISTSVVITLMPPLIISFTLDNAIMGAEYTTFAHRLFGSILGTENVRYNLWIPMVAIVALTSVRSLAGYTNNRLQALACESIIRTMRNKIYDHMQKLPYAYHVQAQAGGLIQRATSDVDNIRTFIAGQVNEMMRTFLLSIIALVVLFNLHTPLALISSIVLPAMFSASYIFNKRLKKAFLHQDEMEEELFETIQENLSGVRVVRAFGRSSYEMEKFSEKNDKFRNLGQALFKQRAIYWACSDFVGLSQLAAIIVFGSYFAIAGELTLGTMLVFTLYANNLIWPIRNMGRILADMGRMGVSLDRIEAILNEPEETDTPGAAPCDLKQNITFSGVNFSYEDGKQVLQNLDITIKNGETVAILGSTGSGKSTIMHLLLRLYDYPTGSIKIGETELRDISKSHLRKKIGLVLQEPFLYSKTIDQNLKMAKDTVLDNEVIAATKTAKAHNFIQGFEKKYDTMLGERGITLSGGQRQRVAIARTIIKDSDILIFDDSLSAVDTETDAQIRNALKEKSKDTTTIIISQRLATLQEADKIFVMEKGRITDIGNHTELISRPGLYKRIWDIQTMLEDELSNE